MTHKSVALTFMHVTTISVCLSVWPNLRAGCTTWERIQLKSLQGGLTQHYIDIGPMYVFFKFRLGRVPYFMLSAWVILVYDDDCLLRSVPYFISVYVYVKYLCNTCLWWWLLCYDMCHTSSVFMFTLSTCLIFVYDDDCYVKICAILYQCVYVYVKYLCNTCLWWWLLC